MSVMSFAENARDEWGCGRFVVFEASRHIDVADAARCWRQEQTHAAKCAFSSDACGSGTSRRAHGSRGE